MKNYFRKHKFLIYCLSIILGALVLLIVYRDFGCFGQCSFDFVVSVWEPISTFTLWCTVLLVLFLSFPTRFFKRWLLYIASWYVPLTIYFAWAWFDPLPGSIINFSRTEAIAVAMSGLIAITLVYLLTASLLVWFRRRAG